MKPPSARVLDLAPALLAHLKQHAAGRYRAIPLATLADFLGTSWREIAAMVEHLREHGHPIGTARAAPHGAFWPVTEKDYGVALRPYLAALKRMMQVYWRMVKNVPYPRLARKMEREMAPPAEPKQGVLFDA